jgi:hypothetical protein
MTTIGEGNRRRHLPKESEPSHVHSRFSLRFRLGSAMMHGVLQADGFLGFVLQLSSQKRQDLHWQNPTSASDSIRRSFLHTYIEA